MFYVNSTAAPKPPSELSQSQAKDPRNENLSFDIFPVLERSKRLFLRKRYVFTVHASLLALLYL